MVRLWFVVIGLLVASGAGAREFVVGTDAELLAALQQVRPGDQILLRPGEYRGGVFALVQGAPDRPILIASLDPARPATLQGRTGLHLAGAQHVTLRGLTIRASTANGINVDDAGQRDRPAEGIRIESCTILDTGPRGNTDGIKLSGLRGFVVTDCTIAGWGGSAIDMVGCHDGVIERCRIDGKPGFDQSTGIQMKGGSSNIIVRQNQLTNAGSRALNVGGSTGIDFFRPPDATAEARDITIEQNVIRGSDAAVAFVGVDGTVFRRNTVIAPTRWVFRILQETRDARFAKCRNVRFERNLIVYPRTLRAIVNIGPDTLPQTFVFEGNWWWCSDGPTAVPDLPTRETNAVVGEDPQLPEDPAAFPKPANRSAREVGAGR
jgi:hypothetical protein